MRWSDANQHVDVIICTVDDQGRSVHLANNPAEIREQISAKRGLD